MRVLGAMVATSAILTSFGVADGQQPSRDAYYSHLPAPPPLVRETIASARFRLYGDRGDSAHRDTDPADGIDDRRAARLALIAEHFSPIIRHNGSSPPRDFRDIAGGRMLHVDWWRDGRLLSMDSLPLIPSADPVEPAVEHALDSAHRALILSYLPEAAPPRAVPAEGRLERVLFVDFAGHDERTWRESHGAADPRQSRIFAHFFVHEQAEARGPGRFLLVAQYWFFYPFNDGPNNHEGDWEHINVAITTRARAGDTLAASDAWGLLDSLDVHRILDTSSPLPLDDLVVQSVDYYFHHRVMTVPYRDAHRATVRATGSPPNIWVDDDFITSATRRRLLLGAGRLATHPLVYIGGRNRGPDELITLRPQFGVPRNNESHGSYPFPGTWAAVGQLDATERLDGPDVPSLRPDADTLPWHEMLEKHEYIAYTRDRIVLLPDWERVVEVLETDDVVRRQWGWMLLPMRFGVPASASPGAGMIPHTDLGNLGAMSPTHNVGWNRLGPTRDHHPYEPAVLRAAAAPVTPWTTMQSGYGALNVPLASWGLLPGGSVATTQLLPWITGTLHLAGLPPARTFFDGPLPTRITTFGYGAYTVRGTHEYARLLPSPAESEALRARVGTAGQPGGYHTIGGTGMRVWFNLFYRRLSLENTFGIHWSDVSYRVPASAPGDASHLITGRLTTRALMGGARLTLLGDPGSTVMLFARGGYGWLDYRVDDQRVDDQHLEVEPREGGYLMSILPGRRWWPNSAYLGGGIELFAPREWWLLGRLGFGLRAEGTGVLHRLRSGTCDACGVNAIHGDFAISTVLGW